jgi:hypothetical protein
MGAKRKDELRMAVRSLADTPAKINKQNALPGTDTQPNQDLLAEVDKLLDENFRTADQARYERLQQQTIVLKTTPTPEPTPRPKPPALTPSVVAKLAEGLRGPLAMELIDRLGRVSNREKWRDALIQLVTKIAPEKGGWVFDAGQDWLGEQWGISGKNARSRMWKLENGGLVRYLHTGKKEGGRVGRAEMRVDLQPLIAELWESLSKVENVVNQDKEFSTFSDDPPTNVHAVYSGTG